MSKTHTTPSGEVPAKRVELLHGKLARIPATVALICINIAVFGAMLLHGAALWHSPNNVQLAWGASFGPATKDGQWWRLGTAMFLHFGLAHLAMNMAALWEAGRLVERLYGSSRFLLAYFASGLTGNLASLIVQGDKAVSGGASGAVFGIYGALLVCLWRERHQLHPIEFRWLFGGASLFSAATFILGLLIPGVDNAAHFGGLVAGALTGMALARPLTAASVAMGRGRWAAAGAYSFAVIALVWSIPPPSCRWREELNAREAILQFQLDDQRITNRWQQILDKGRQRSASFEELAEQIEFGVAREYRASFEQLSALQLDPAAPSAHALEALKVYTQSRGDASQSLAERLRSNGPKRIRDALEVTSNAPHIATGEKPPPPTVSVH
jgi:rhomboid protease GluP